MNWPIRNSTQIRIRIELVGNTIMWNPSLFFISNIFYKTQNNFGPSHHYGIFMGCHHVTGRAQYWHLAVTCNITVAIDKTIKIVAYLLYQLTKKIIRGLCNMNQWWWWHRSLTLAYFGRNFVCFVIYLPISPQGRPRFELSYRVYFQQPVEFKIVRTEK